MLLVYNRICVRQYQRFMCPSLDVSLSISMRSTGVENPHDFPQQVSVDVYSGAKEPLLGRVVESDEYFGSDGLGDVPHLHPILELASSPQDDPDAPHAALRLVQVMITILTPPIPTQTSCSVLHSAPHTIRLHPMPFLPLHDLQRARELRGSLVVVALGPLTNLALASLIDPAFPSLVKELHVMGGAIGKGNVTPHAEFNFYFDAEAADGEEGECV